MLPKSPVAQAIYYAQNHWQAVLRFTEQGFFKNIDNNASEWAMRPAAMCRKNWLFAGSDEGPYAAVLYTLTQTCLRHGIDPFAYLQDVLTSLPEGLYESLNDFFPHNRVHRTATTWPAGRATGRLAEVVILWIEAAAVRINLFLADGLVHGQSIRPSDL